MTFKEIIDNYYFEPIKQQVHVSKVNNYCPCCKKTGLFSTSSMQSRNYSKNIMICIDCLIKVSDMVIKLNQEVSSATMLK
jgi:hypothetical protein